MQHIDRSQHTSNSGRRGRRRAATMAGLAVGALVITACGSDAATSDETERDDAGDVVDGGDVGSLRLQVGDCLAAEAIGQVETVPVVPCSEPHDSELYHSFDLTGDEYPGEDAVAESAGQGCLAEFEAFIGLAYEDSVWDITTIYPSEQTWNGVNDREVLCGVFPLSDEDTTGSARGIAE